MPIPDRRGLALTEFITYSSPGCAAVLPTNATAPVLETLISGLASTSPRSSFFALPWDGCPHSAERVPSSPSSSSALPPGSQA